MQQQLKKYLIQTGAQGEVFKFEYLNKTYAVKKVSVLDTHSHQLKEDQILRKLPKHRNIVKYYGCQFSDKKAYLVFEYVQGFTLSDIIDWVANVDVPEKIILNWLMQLTLALIHLQKHGIIHRDIKPDNVMVTKEGVVKLIDFGLAIQRRDKRSQKKYVGTKYYMSPQLVDYDKRVGFETDIWSLGGTFYSLLNHKHPFEAQLNNFFEKYKKKNLSQINKKQFINGYHKTINQTPIRSKTCHTEVDRLINKMLMKNNQQRITIRDIARHSAIFRQLKQFAQYEDGIIEDMTTSLLQLMEKNKNTISNSVDVGQLVSYQSYLDSQ